MGQNWDTEQFNLYKGLQKFLYWYIITLSLPNERSIMVNGKCG